MMEVMLKLINFLVFANCQILKLPDLRDETTAAAAEARRSASEVN